MRALWRSRHRSRDLEIEQRPLPFRRGRFASRGPCRLHCTWRRGGSVAYPQTVRFRAKRQAQVPPLGLRRHRRLPPRQVHTQGNQHAHRHHHLRQSGAAVVAILAPGVTCVLTPQAHHTALASGSQHPRPAQHDLVLAARPAAIATAIAFTARALARAVFEQVTMICRHDHDPACVTRFPQQGHQQTQALQPPGLMQLIRAGEVVVHRVVHHPHHLLSAIGDRCTHLRRQAAVLGQFTLMEQARRQRGIAVRKQGGMRCKRTLLLPASARRDGAREQTRAADLGHRREGGHPGQGMSQVAAHPLRPAERRQLGEQLPEDADAQPIHDQQQHGVRRCQRCDQIGEGVLHRHDAR